ncbi:MAG: phage portal protein [Oxalobacteraceae bacterium]|nr:MAG: phage portal protein [Oxalobacteraceae bacterium]
MVWSCVKILSESLSGLPLKLFDDGDGGRKQVTGTDSALKLLKKPNPYMTRLNFLKFVVVNMALRGNAFALIEHNRNGDAIGFVPLSFDMVSIDTDDELVYWVTPKNSDRFPVSPESMLHFKLFSLDGIVGLSPIEYQAETMGLAKAGQQWSSRFMRKGGFTGGYVIYENFLNKQQEAQIMAKFPDVRKGDADDIGKMAILQGNPKIVPAGLSQRDAQFIESQQFQEEALAGIYGVPLWLANRAGKTSIMGSNLEQQLTGYITFGLKPYIDAVEDELNDKVYNKKSRFVEFKVEGLLRADSAGRASYYQAALGGSGGSGWMSINEVREKENEMPLEGDEYNQVTRWEMTKNVEA